MKYLAIILLTVIASASNCGKKGKRTDLSTKKAAAFFLGKKIDTVRWQLVKTYDPYEGGKTIVRDTLNPEILIVSKNGTFTEYDKDNHSIGRWYLNREKTRMAMVYEEQNGEKVQEMQEEMAYRYEIREMSDTTLVLALQGRHGMVERTYKPFEQSEQEDSDAAESTDETPPIEK